MEQMKNMFVTKLEMEETKNSLIYESEEIKPFYVISLYLK